MSAVAAFQPSPPPPPPPPPPTPTTTDSPKSKAVVTEGGNKTTTEKKKRTKKKSRRHPRKNTLKTKVIVRRLPPNLPEDIFNNSIKTWISQDVVDYSIYVPGKLSKSKAKESVFSRAYFHFKTMEAVVAFHQGFDGHVFMDSRGNEYRAVVEFAPYQRIPKERTTQDVRQGTVDEDQDYLNFLESLKAEEKSQSELLNEPADGLSQIERLENRIAMVTAKTLAAEQANKPKTTPLLEHLRAQKAAQAAAKAKQIAKKNARKRNEKSTPATPSSIKKEQSKTVQQQNSKEENISTDGATTAAAGATKKKRERNRKKKEVANEGWAKISEANDKEEAATSKPSSRPPANEINKEKKPRPQPKKEPRPTKENSNTDSASTTTNKPKRQNHRKSNNKDGSQQQQQQQPVKILGRQPVNKQQSTSG